MPTRYPVSDFYKSQIMDGVTVARKGGWWTAVLLIRDPRNQKPFVGLYRWQKTSDGWKTRSSFKIRQRKQVDQIVERVEELGQQL